MVTGYGGREWWTVSVDLPAGATHLRWSSSADVTSQGRGVYVDKIHAMDQDGMLFSGEGADAGRVVASGWSVSHT
ncbi:hypothetical protein JNW88_31575 [Micromonospora sp. ATA32]|nr:hypothetical protein [Micromonospora sp. ATA32]